MQYLALKLLYAIQIFIILLRNEVFKGHLEYSKKKL